MGVALRLFLLVALTAAAARAGNVSNEFSVNTTQATETNPRSGSIGDAINADFDLSDPLTLNLGAMITSQSSSPSPVPNESASGAVALLNAGLDWELNDNWTLGVSGEWSPQTTQFAEAPLLRVYTAHIRSLSSELGGGIDLSYDTTGTSDLEWSFGGGARFTHWNIDQSIPRLTDAQGNPVTKAKVQGEVNALCARFPNPRNCSRRVLGVLAATPFDLNSLEFSGNVVAIIKTNTDLGLTVDYYAYLQDATQTRYAALIFNGRGGAGVPVAPLRYMIRPELTHRFGDFSAKLWVQAGEYVAETGGSTAGIGLKLQYKFTKAFRMWVRGLGSRDTDDQGNSLRSVSLSVGAGYHF